MHLSPPAPRELRAEIWLPLLQDALTQHGRFTLPLRGDSMSPTLPLACEIDIVPLVTAPRLGQLIVFAAGDALVAHRLVRRRQGSLIAHADNRRAPDGPLRPDQVLGIVSAAHVDGRRVWPQRGEAAWRAFWLARSQVLQAARWAVNLIRR